MTRSRIHLLDELRGFCILLMLAFHAFYTIGFLFRVEWFVDLFYFFQPAEPFFAGIFILLCGFSCRLSRSNVKRGLLLGVVSIGMSVVLFVVMPDQMIWFGILHCLTICILLFAALRPLLDRVPSAVAIAVFLLLFLLTRNIPFYNGGSVGIGPLVLWEWPREWAASNLLLPLGIGTLFGADYFPLFPWVFCFLIGSELGKLRHRLPAFAMRRHLPPLGFLGRHSLIIYIVHQPLLYGVCSLMAMCFF